MDKLRECPFCSGEANTTVFRGITGFLCDNCGGVISFRHKEEHGQAISAWNNRAEKPNEPLNNWIPVSERLPIYNPNEGAKAYWVAFDTKQGKQMRIAIFSDYLYTTQTAIPQCITWRDDNSHKIGNVTHWMPLPKPPKEADQTKLFEITYLDDAESATYLTTGKDEKTVREREEIKLNEECHCFIGILHIEEIKEVDGNSVKLFKSEEAD